MSEFFDKHGKPITVEEWGTLHNDHDYCRVASEFVGPFWVSTVWLGMNHNYGDGPPLIFETMVFRSEVEGVDYADLDCRRYTTLEEAIEGHAEMAEDWRQVQHKAGVLMPGDTDD